MLLDRTVRTTFQFECPGAGKYLRRSLANVFLHPSIFSLQTLYFGDCGIDPLVPIVHFHDFFKSENVRSMPGRSQRLTRRIIAWIGNDFHAVISSVFIREPLNWFGISSRTTRNTCRRGQILQKFRNTFRSGNLIVRNNLTFRSTFSIQLR